MDRPEEIFLGKYQITGRLGEGGTSFVYKARDLKSDQWVAIKWMKPDTTSRFMDDQIRFKREIETVSKLNHPGVVHIIEAGEWNQLPFLVMEHLEGESLAGLLERTRRLSAEVAVTWIKQLSEILNYVHGKGVIHRDLKPGNIFITYHHNEVQFKVLDFGLSLLAELRAIHDGHEIAGTFGYMSPEATGILNSQVDERSDLYSLGVIFYQLLTGELPFKAKKVSQLIHEQVAYKPLELQKLNPEISVTLNRMAMKLLAKDPDLRYQSAKGLLHDLDRFLQGERDFTLGIKDAKVKLTYQPRLIGRSTEIDRLKELYHRVESGSGTVLLISGEPGIGKSRLVEELHQSVYNRSGLFLMGRCINHENKTPYQPFKDILDEYIRRFETAGESAVPVKEQLKMLLGDLGEIALRINPRFERLIGKNKALVPLEPDRETQRFLMVLTKLFCQLPNSGKPTVIFLDDLQWADEGSLALLQEIIKEIHHFPTLVIGTYRDNEIVPEHGIHQIRALASGIGDSLSEIKLTKLTPDDIHLLVSTVLGRDAGVDPGLKAFVLEKSHGNPLFAINILRELVENKAVLWNGCRWETDWDEVKQVPIADSIVEFVVQRVQNLNTEQTDLLCKAAIIGRAFDLDLLFCLTHLSKEDVVADVDEFVDMLLLEKSIEHGRLLFAHDRIRDAFCQKLTAAEKEAIHLEIAATMEAKSHPDYHKLLFELAHHYVEGNDPLKALQYVLPAADQAKASYANEVAVKYYQIALQLLTRLNLEHTDDWIRVNKNLAEVYLTVGKNHEAIQISKDILQWIHEPVEEALTYRKIGIAHFKIGTWDQSEQNLKRTLALLGENIPNHQILPLLDEMIKFVWHCIFKYGRSGSRLNGVAVPGSRQIISQEIVHTYYTLNWMYILTNIHRLVYSLLRMVNISETYLKGSKELALSYSYCSVSFMYFPWLKRAINFQERALAIRKQWDDQWGIAQSWQFFGWIYCWSGQHQIGIDSFRQSETAFQKIGDMWEYGMALQGLMVEYYYIANYAMSLHYAKRYMEESIRINNYYGYNMAILLTGLCYLETGDYPKAEEFLNQALQESKERKIWFNHCIVMAYFGILKTELGQFEAAVEVLEDCRKLYEANSFIKDHTINIYPYLAFAYLQKFKNQLQTGEVFNSHRDLNKILMKCKEALKLTRKWPNHFGFALRVTAGCYALIGKDRKAEAYYLKSIQHTREINRSFETGKSYFEYGNFLRTQHRPPVARENLEIAYEIFREIGSRDYQERCRVLVGFEADSEIPAGLSTRDRLTASRRWDTVLATSRYISSILNIDELLTKVLNHAMELVGAARGVLLLYPEAGEKRLEPKAIRNVTLDEADYPMFVSQSILGQLEKVQKSIIITDALSDKDLSKQSSVLLHHIRSVICAPILNHGEMLGVLYLDNNMVGGLFSEEDAEVLDVITSQAGVSIENARLYNQMRAYSNEVEASRQQIAKWNQTLEQKVRERTEELDLKNGELNRMVGRLQEHAATIEELATVKERNRLAMDVHDTLGNTMTLLIKLLEAAKINIRNNPGLIEERLNEAITVARDGFAELKRSIKGLAPGRLETDTFESALRELAREYQTTGVAIDFKVDKIPKFKDKLFSITVFKICQEAVTNAIRHGKTKHIAIRMRTVSDQIILSVKDDGDGCPGFAKGSGIRGMEQRTAALNGKITFTTFAGKGFEIKVEIPAGWDGEP